MARRKLEGTLTEYEHEDAIVNGHKAEESLEDIYHKLRQKLGARHQLTLKAEQARDELMSSNAESAIWSLNNGTTKRYRR